MVFSKAFALLNNVQNVQECDARGDAKYYTAWLKEIVLKIVDLRKLNSPSRFYLRNNLQKLCSLRGCRRVWGSYL